MDVESDAWRDELQACSALVQDSDTSVAPEEAEHRFMRYVELIDMVTGTESARTFQAVVDSIRAPEDYGAYEAVHNALWRFPPEQFAQYFVRALPGLIHRMARHDQVGRFLCPLTGHGRSTHLPAFNRRMAQAHAEDRDEILKFVRENSEWFGDDGAIGSGIREGAAMGREAMSPPRIYADFNGLVDGPKTPGRLAVPLNTAGSIRDLVNAGITLMEGMALIAFDESDEKEDLEGHGAAVYDHDQGWWVIEFDESGVRDVPAGDRKSDSMFLCVSCRADISGHLESLLDCLGGDCPLCETPLRAPISPPGRPHRGDGS